MIYTRKDCLFMNQLKHKSNPFRKVKGQCSVRSPYNTADKWKSLKRQDDLPIWVHFKNITPQKECGKGKEFMEKMVQLSFSENSSPSPWPWDQLNKRIRTAELQSTPFSGASTVTSLLCPHTLFCLTSKSTQVTAGTLHLQSNSTCSGHSIIPAPLGAPFMFPLNSLENENLGLEKWLSG